MSNEENKHKDAGQGGQERSKPEIRYVPVDMREIVNIEENEIDLVDLLKTIWNGRKTIYKTIAGFVIVGLAVALFSVEEYTSHVKVLPETNESVSLGSLGGLAQQFGISSSGQVSSEEISANLYPSIIQSDVFLKNLLQHEVQVAGEETAISYKEYYSKYMKRSPVRTLIRLPLTLKNWLTNLIFNKSDSFEALSAERGKTDRLVRMTDEEWEIIRILRQRVTANMDPETGAITISVKMQDPVIAAEIVDEVVQNLSEFIIEKRTEKTRRDVEFIEERVEDAKQDFEKVQKELASFNDANRGQLTAMARTEEQLLQSRYNLNFNLYNSMAERLEQARIKLQEETPVINILEPPAVPDRRSEPKRTLLLIIFMLLGTIAGIGVVFVIPMINKFREEFS